MPEPYIYLVWFSSERYDENHVPEQETENKLHVMLCLISVKNKLSANITKTYLYDFDPHKPHFYTVKLGFTGVYIMFLILAQKHRLWVLIRTALPRQF